MPLVPRTRVQIRDAQLADLAARYAANGRALDTSDASDARMRGEVLALALEQYDAWGAQLDDEILPDKATFTLVRHGNVEGLARHPATAAVLYIGFTGVPSATVALAGATLVDPATGATWTVSTNADGSGASVVMSGGGAAVAYATAQLAGAAGNRPAGAILTWSSTPANANPGPGVISTSRPGADTESPEDFAARILAHRQDRPAGGNRADLADWCTSVAGCVDAVVYPLLHPTYGVGTPGSVTVVCLGPVQGAGATNTRILSSPFCAQIKGYINGDNNADGSTSPAPEQLRPAGLAAGDIAIEPAIEQDVDVELQVVLAASSPAPWAYNAGYTIVAGSSTVLVKLAGDLRAALNGATAALPLLVRVSTTAARGGYVLATPAALATYDGTNTNIALPVALPALPAFASVVLPGLPNWAAIQAAVFAYFDGLGPGDTSPPSRWPTEEQRLRSVLYRSALAGSLAQTVDRNAVLLSGVGGVLSATVLAPSTDVAPAAKTLLTLHALSVHT